eukprot:TRINITY_DN100401_c0_g1_i1.p1 TRINITY_DN100401_c0_g1~~TRINITY_DN100401_c0_g1_i1.p1  ORF type:complete len:487 (-),score=31.18 TRINITY_DN100401_c0_g1_i1:98-1558(-)
MAASESSWLRVVLFFEPEPSGLLRVWKFAGPACCCKAACLAVGAGPAGVATSGGCLQRAQRARASPCLDWWRSVAVSDLVPCIYAPHDDKMISLDWAWIAMQVRPDLVTTATPMGRPIILAIQRGRRDIAELLRSRGAVLNNRTANELLFDFASKGNAESIAVMLFDSRGYLRSEPWAAVNFTNRQQESPLDAAARHGHKTCLSLLRRAGARHSLRWAARCGIPSDVAFHIAEGEDVDLRDGSGSTALCEAVKGPSDDTARILACRALSASDGSAREKAVTPTTPREECLRLLLEARACVNVLPISMETPLAIAASMGQTRHCEQLLLARADPLIKDRSGRDALEKAKGEGVLELLSKAVESTMHVQPPAGLANGCDSCSDESPEHCGYTQLDYGAPDYTEPSYAQAVSQRVDTLHPGTSYPQAAYAPRPFSHAAHPHDIYVHGVYAQGIYAQGSYGHQAYAAGGYERGMLGSDGGKGYGKGWQSF